MICASGVDINTAADALCRRARASELRVEDLIQDKTNLEHEAHNCAGQVALLKEQLSKPVAEPIAFWIRVALDVGAVALSSTAAACWLVDDCPDTLAVGLSVAGLGALGVRIALEF